MPSTLIKASHYDPERRVLSVWLLPTGRRYDYLDVPPATWNAFRASFAKGRFFSAHIRNRYAWRRVEDDATE